MHTDTHTYTQSTITMAVGITTATIETENHQRTMKYVCVKGLQSGRVGVVVLQEMEMGAKFNGELGSI